MTYPYPSGTEITWPFDGVPEQFCTANQHIRVGYDFEKKCFTGYYIEDNKYINN